MPAKFRTVDEVVGLTATTQRLLDGANRAHRGVSFFFDGREVRGRWNVVAEYQREGRTLELARFSGAQAPGVYHLELARSLTEPHTIIPEPTSVRYFTTSAGALLSGALLIAYED